MCLDTFHEEILARLLCFNRAFSGGLVGQKLKLKTILDLRDDNISCASHSCYAGQTLSNEHERNDGGELYISALLSEESIERDARQEDRRTLSRQKAAMRRVRKEATPTRCVAIVRDIEANSDFTNCHMQDRGGVYGHTVFHECFCGGKIKQ